MLLEGGLKLLCSVVVVVVVGCFFARRKWRQSAAWNEEVRRRMAFAREDTLKAELEAAAGYSSYGSVLAPEPAVEEPVFGFVRQFQHECKICFRPTTTRCKQCKAVHYCSRECQTLHWRQGHKKECRLFTPHRNTDAGVHSFLKEQDEIQSSQDVVWEVTNTIKPVESFSGEHIFSDPIACVPSNNNDTETETSDDEKRTEINVKAPVHSFPGEFSSFNISAEKSVALGSNLKDCDRYDAQSTSVNVESMKPLLSIHSGLTNPEHHVAAANVPNRLSSGSADTDKKSNSSTSSGCGVDVSEEDSLSEPSAPSDFFGVTVETIRSKIDALDEFGDVNMSNSRSSFHHISGRINGNDKMLGSDMNSVMADDALSAKSMPKRSTALSEVSEDDLKSKGLPSLNCKLFGQNVVRNNPAEYSSKKEAKLSSSNAGGEQISEGHIPSNQVANVSNLSSLAPKQLHHEIDQKNGILDSLNCQGNDSLRLRSSEAHLSSTSTGKPAILDVQSAENGCDHGGACSLDSNGYVHSATSGTNPSTRRTVYHLRAGDFIRHGSLGAGSGILERFEGSFPYKLFVKLYNGKMVELCPTGLRNCGNSCYANAVLQCLAFTPPLTAYFLQGLHSKACKEKDWCFTCEFEALVKKAKAGISPLSPDLILSQIRRVGSHLGNGRQEDAHEFLGYAIKAMQNVCLKEVGVDVPSSLAEETTLLGLTFGGYLQSKIDCMRCGSKSRKDERIMDLTVEIGGEIGTLEDALHQFTQPEDLDGENKYYCSRCKSYVRAKKKLGVSEAPNVLTIVLKRFQSGEFGKLNKAVKYPQVLNLGSYMSGTSDTSPVYQLYGVVVHVDVMNATSFGHYVCYIKNNHKKWFKADDSRVEPVDVEKVLSTDAYMLFYARCSPRAPKLLRSSMIKAKNLSSSKPKPHPWGDVSASQLRSSSSESLSEYSSSFFSDVGSHSTESSKRTSSTSTDDYLFDQMLGCEISDLDRCYSSDAETTSSSCSVNV